MTSILSDTVDNDTLKEAESRYYSDQASASSDGRSDGAGVEFKLPYASCLVRSGYTNDIHKGLALLDEMVRSSGLRQCHRDCFYYMAIGRARLKDYNDALKFISRLLDSEPSNRQAIALEKEIKEKMYHEAKVGAAAAGGAVLIAGGVIAVAAALLKKR